MSHKKVIIFVLVFITFNSFCCAIFPETDRGIKLSSSVKQFNSDWIAEFIFTNVSSKAILVVLDNQVGESNPKSHIGVTVEPHYSSSGTVFLSSLCSFELMTLQPGDSVVVDRAKLSRKPTKKISFVIAVHEDFESWFGAWSGALETTWDPLCE